MTLTPTQISFAILAVALIVALLLWFRHSEAATSARRTMDMMTRIDLDLGAAARRESRIVAILSESRRRCQRCPREDLCDRWLAGDVKGDNAFCANAQTFRALGKAPATTGWPAAIRPAS